MCINTVFEMDKPDLLENKNSSYTHDFLRTVSENGSPSKVSHMACGWFNCSWCCVYPAGKAQSLVSVLNPCGEMFLTIIKGIPSQMKKSSSISRQSSVSWDIPPLSACLGAERCLTNCRQITRSRRLQCMELDLFCLITDSFCMRTRCL